MIPRAADGNGYQVLQERQAKLEQTLRWLNRIPDAREGYCRCGCGGRPKVSQYGAKARGIVRGKPFPYLRGHANRIYQAVRVDLSTKCWIWLKNIKPDTKYGQSASLGASGRKVNAHKLVWEYTFGPTPDRCDMDHLCRVPACVNPVHLEPVTHVENIRRGKHVRLNKKIVGDMRIMWMRGVMQKDIAAHFGVSISCTRGVIVGRTWRGI